MCVLLLLSIGVRRMHGLHLRKSSPANLHQCEELSLDDGHYSSCKPDIALSCTLLYVTTSSTCRNVEHGGGSLKPCKSAGLPGAKACVA